MMQMIVAMFRSDLDKKYYVVYNNMKVKTYERLNDSMRYFMWYVSTRTIVWRGYTIMTTNEQMSELIIQYIVTVKGVSICQ